jgi:hypothetical protein
MFTGPTQDRALSAALRRGLFIRVRKVVERLCPGKPERQCREMIKTWVRNGVLYSEPYDDPDRRERVQGLRLDISKRPG